MSNTVSGREVIESDVVAIGAGQAAIPFVHAVAEIGRSAVLVERKRLGGSCVNFGCTPTKAALASAQRADDSRHLARFGITVDEVKGDFSMIMERARGFALRARLNLVQTFVGVGNPVLVRGHARFWGREGKRFRVVVDDGPVILADRVILDTGTRSIIPSVAGLDILPVITAENWLEVERAPTHLIMLGSGPIGLEMAQLYRRLGADVTIIERASQILPQEDRDVAEAVKAALTRQGIAILLNAKAASAAAHGQGLSVTLEDGNVIQASDIFVAAGRRAAVEQLGLDSLGICPSDGGTLEVNEQLETSVQGLFAAGDIRGGLPLTQTAWDDHRILLTMFPGFPSHSTRRVVPYAIFTDPEVARVGLNEREVSERNIPHRMNITPYASIAKAREIGRERGFIKLISDARREKLLGATIVGTSSGELIHLLAILMHLDAPLDAIRSGIFAHPTLGEGVQSAVTALLDEKEAA